MKLHRDVWERVANNYVTMGKEQWASKIREALTKTKRATVTIDLEKVVKA